MWTLFQLFIGVFIVWVGYLGMVELGIMPTIGRQLTFAQFLHVALTFLSTSMTYTWLYSLVEIDSPSLRIILAIHDAGSNGIGREELEQKTGMDLFFESRIKKMFEDGMVYAEQGRYFATKRGRLPKNLVLLVRRIVGIKQDLG